MGQVAGELSDLVILTRSDNPRSEDPLQIMNDVLVGLRRTDTRTIVEPDRAEAIRKAIEEAHAGDIVILAGKGHETYQIFRDRTIHFRRSRSRARSTAKAYGFGKTESAGQHDHFHPRHSGEVVRARNLVAGGLSSPMALYPDGASTAAPLTRETASSRCADL